MRERERATQGQSRLLKALTSRQKLYVLEEKGLRGTQAVKSFLESSYSLSKNFMWERGRATQGQSRLFITTLHLLHNQFMRKRKACVGRRP